MKEIEDATSSLSAPITGATAAMAELPQIELPQAIRIHMRCGRPNAPADEVAAPDRNRDDRGDAEDQRRAERQNSGDADRGTKHDDGDFEHEFAENRCRESSAARHPGAADRDAEQNRQHQRFEVRLSDEFDFDGLQGGRRMVIATQRACRARDVAADRSFHRRRAGWSGRAQWTCEGHAVSVPRTQGGSAACCGYALGAMPVISPAGSPLSQR